MTHVRLRKTLILFVVAMMLAPAISLAVPAGDGDVPVPDDAPGFVGAGEGIEPISIDVDIYEDRFTPIMPWPTNRTFYDMVRIGDYFLMAGSGGTLLKLNETGIERIHTGTEESLYDIAYDWPLALIAGNHSTLFVWNSTTEDLTRIDVPYDQRFLGVTWDDDGDEAIIVGNGGFIGTFNGTHVNALTTGLSDFIYRVKWVPGGDHAVAVGDGGLLVRVNTTEVMNITRLDIDWGLWRLDWDYEGIFAIIVGMDYSFLPPRSLVVRYNITGTFNSIPVPGSLTSGLRSVAYNDDDVPGGGYFLIAGENSTVLLCDGTSNAVIVTPYDRTLRACLWWKPLDMGRDFYVAGNRGVIMHHVDGVWSNVSFDPRGNNIAIDWRPQGDYGLVVGRDGFMSKVSPSGGTLIDTGVTNDLLDVDWSADGSYALACGTGGIVVRYNHGDSQTTTMRTGLNALRGVSVKPGANEALAVGDGGHIWHYSSGIWTDKKPLGIERNLWDVAWRPDGAFAIIVGVSGSVLNFTGVGLASSFVPQPDTYAPLFSVAWDKNGEYAMAVGSRDSLKDYDTIWVYNNVKWGPVGYDSGATFYGCAFTADGEVGVAFGAPDHIVKFSTSTWEGIRSSFSSPYTLLQRGCMHPTGRAVYFAGSNGYAYRMDVGEFANNPPVVAIASPRTGATFDTGEVIELSANGTWDPDDDPLEMTWWSNLTGFLARGKVAHVTLEKEGWHNIDLHVDDGKGHNITDFVIIRVQVPDIPPVPIINSPTEGATYTNEDLIVFDASGSFDPNGGDLTYQWLSDTSGNIGDEERVEASLRVDEHRIILWVEDENGTMSSESVNISVVQANRPPVVYITSPQEGDRFEPDESIEFNASYSFDPDGDELTYRWVDAQDGLLGEGKVIQSVLSAGHHNITLTVSDNEYDVTATVNVTVEEPENLPPVITLTSPPSNTSVSGIVIVTGVVTDPEGDDVTVSYAIRTKDDWQEADVDGTSWSFTWDTTAISNGQYTVFVKADDGVNTRQIWAQYFVENVEPENTPPEVTLVSPEPGTVKGVVRLEGLATDADGDVIQRVQVRFDSGLWEEATGGNAWSFTWDTVKTPNGPVVVSVRAFDGEDYSQVETYNFNVENEDPEPAPGSNLVLWVLMFMVVVIVVVGVWVWYMRR